MNPEYPSLVKRLQSTFIDMLVIIALMGLISALIGQFRDVPKEVVIALSILVCCYEPLATSLGATAGNYLMGIRVRRADHPDQRIGFFTALVRFIVKVMLGWISFLTIHSNEQRRAIHDMAGGSVVLMRQ